ncbi:MAG TPA: hypothetical protein VLA21_01330, partial [Candidatus Limnocylindria bacterium]|nr:hypothetical protein [Candidatus Limnocylindria bacterium]
MGRDGAGKPGILGAALYVAAALFLPLARFRPNRILTGDALPLASLGPGGTAAAAALAALALLFLFLHARRSPWAAPVSVLAALGAVAALAWASRLPHLDGETARVSIGAGFFVMLPAALLMLRTAGKRAMRLGTVAVLAFAAGLLLWGAFARLSLLREFEARRETFFAHTARHLALALSAAGAAAVLGILLSFLLLRFRRLEAPAVFAVNLAQTVPTLSLLGLLLALLVFLGR